MFRSVLKASEQWIALDLTPGLTVNGVSPLDVRAAYYAYLAEPAEQEETTVSNTTDPKSFEVIVQLSTGQVHSWSVGNAKDEYAAYSAMAELFDSITQQMESSPRVQVLTNASLEQIPSSLITHVSIVDRRTPEQQEKLSFGSLVRRYAGENRHTAQPRPAPSISQLGEAVWVWWDEAGLAGGARSTREEAEVELAAYKLTLAPTTTEPAPETEA